MTTPDDQAEPQLATIARLSALLQRQGIEWWLFGGWAVDFHVGHLTRAHDDIDIATWYRDREILMPILVQDGWAHRADADGDGYTCFEHDTIRLEVAFLARDDKGNVYTPIESGRAEWPRATFGSDTRELLGVTARVITRDALVAEKSVVREDATTAAKDRADVMELTQR